MSPSQCLLFGDAQIERNATYPGYNAYCWPWQYQYNNGYAGEYIINGAYSSQYIHNGPNILYFDGHCARYLPPKKTGAAPPLSWFKLLSADDPGVTHPYP